MPLLVSDDEAGVTEGLRNARLVQSIWILDPGVGQEQPHRQGVMALGADVVHRGGDLAIGLLAQGPAILPPDADGVRALFGERHVVEDEDAARVGERPGQAGTEPQPPQQGEHRSPIRRGEDRAEEKLAARRPRIEQLVASGSSLAA